MILPMHAAQVVPVHVGVELRRCEVGVPQHLLDRPQVRAALEQMSGEAVAQRVRSEEHTSELQSQSNLVCRLLLEKKNNSATTPTSARQYLTTCRRKPG